MTCANMRAETVGAFFDLDGTLLPAPSLEWRFIGYLLERREISSAHAGRWLARFAGTFWHDLHGATLGNKLYLRGISEALANEWEKSLAPIFPREDSLPFFAEGLQRIAWHRAQRHRVFLVSGTLAPLARAVTRILGALVSTEIEVCATELEVTPGTLQIWSGRIAGEHMSGGAKSRAVLMLAARYRLDLSRSYAYGDSAGDLQMLEGVGYGVAVNPTRRLARLARKRGWRMCVWETTFGEIPDLAARRLASKVAR
jgi:HAD superfamily phosphoserine phosphatase-like hydrolase